MIFTNPIQYSPIGQIARNRVPLVIASAPNAPSTEYRLTQADEDADGTLTTFASRTLATGHSPYEYVLKLGLSGIPVGNDVRVRITSSIGSPIASWRKKAHDDRGTAENPDIQVIEQYPIFLIPHDRNATAINILVNAAGGVSLEWVIFERIIGIVFPSLTIKGQLAQVRKSTKTFSAKTFTTRQSADPVYNMRIAAKNDPRDELGPLFADLDRVRVFGVIPSGIEREFANSPVPFRALDFARNMEVARYSGGSGHAGSDVLGFSASLDMRESSVQRYKTASGGNVLADFFGLVTEGGDPITTERDRPLNT